MTALQARTEAHLFTEPTVACLLSGLSPGLVKLVERPAVSSCSGHREEGGAQTPFICHLCNSPLRFGPFPPLESLFWCPMRPSPHRPSPAPGPAHPWLPLSRVLCWPNHQEEQSRVRAQEDAVWGDAAEVTSAPPRTAPGPFPAIQSTHLPKACCALDTIPDAGRSAGNQQTSTSACVGSCPRCHTTRCWGVVHILTRGSPHQHPASTGNTSLMGSPQSLRMSLS